MAFDGPQPVDRVVISTGLHRDDAEWSKQHVPQTVDLLFSDGTCARAPLENRDGEQSFPVSVGKATEVQLMVVQAYPPRTGVGDTVSLSEVNLLKY